MLKLLKIEKIKIQNGGIKNLKFMHSSKVHRSENPLNLKEYLH